MPSASSILPPHVFFPFPARCYLLLLLPLLPPGSKQHVYRLPASFHGASFFLSSPRQRWNWTWQMSPEMEPNLTCRHRSHFGSRYTLGSCCKAGLLPFYFFHVAIHGTLTQLRPKILLSLSDTLRDPEISICLQHADSSRPMQLAGRTTRKNNSRSASSSFLQTYAAGWKNKKKNNSRWSTPAGSW